MERDELLEEYIDSHTTAEPVAVNRIWRRSNLHLVGGRMCSGHIQGRLLKMMVQIAGAKRVLELGTFSGYASVCLAEGLPEDGKLITIEHEEELEDFIRQSLHEAGVEDKVEVRFGDALELMAGMETGSVDLLFMDADKRSYPEYYKEARRLVRRGGLILADNTLWDGHVVEPAYENDPQTAAIRKFNDLVAEDPGVEQVILPLRDGLTVIRVNGEWRMENGKWRMMNGEWRMENGKWRGGGLREQKEG